MSSAIQPTPSPSARLPPSSRAKTSATVPAPRPPAPGSAAMSSSTEKIAIAMPSLKSDSPAIWASRSGGAFAARRMESTATGSVGEMSAPKSRLSSRLMPRPSARLRAYARPPTTAVEMRAPTLASSAMPSFWPFKASRSTLSAPANRRSASIPSSTSDEKSRRFTSDAAAPCSGSPSRSAAMSASDRTSAMSVTPIVVGRPMKRRLR